MFVKIWMQATGNYRLIPLANVKFVEDGKVTLKNGSVYTDPKKKAEDFIVIHDTNSEVPDLISILIRSIEKSRTSYETQLAEAQDALANATKDFRDQVRKVEHNMSDLRSTVIGCKEEIEAATDASQIMAVKISKTADKVNDAFNSIMETESSN